MAKLDLNELTLAELKAKAVKLGMPEDGMEGFKSKAPLIATINALRAKVKRVKTLNPPESPSENKTINKMWLSKAERMRDKLAKQEKIRILLPLEGKQKVGVLKKVEVNGRKEYIHVSGAIETVTLNGYKTIVPRGAYFTVPKQVADVLANSYKQTQEAGKEFLLDRENPKTGKTVRDSM